ncbi:MAG: hypothetical protein V7638_4704 [Acidobacteriota bacterium]|jgi:hypothetical protein
MRSCRESKLKRVRDLCISEKSREEIDRKISVWDYRIYVTFDPFDDEKITMNVANCNLTSVESLKKKLLQLPQGTVFKWKTADTSDDGSRTEELFEKIKIFLTEHGMSLKLNRNETSRNRDHGPKRWRYSVE